MLHTVSAAELSKSGPRDLSDRLERGEIIYFPETPVPLPSPEEAELLRNELGARLQRKNVSYYVEAKRLKGIKNDPALAEKVEGILARRSATVQQFLRKVMPELTAQWTVGTTSFRPLQEKGRDLSAHASNELVHVDAGAYGATHGDRVLRFFTNLNTAEDRVWCTKGTFAELYQRFAEEARIAGPRSLREGPLDAAFSGLLRAAGGAGLKMARMIDSSPYDRLMRRFHNFMKDTPAFQAITDTHRELRFPPMSSWMVLTDTVSHACLSGQHAFVDTFLIRLSQCRIRETAPYYVLETAPVKPPVRAEPVEA